MSNLINNKTEQGVKRSREGWFGKIASLFNRPGIEEDVWEELEELLIAADVGMDTAEKLLTRVKQHAREQKLTEGPQVQSVLKEEMIHMLSVEKRTPAGAVSGGLQIILVVGVNGSGKTTSIAKLTQHYKQQGKQVILAAADTFRAAAIEQRATDWRYRPGFLAAQHLGQHNDAVQLPWFSERASHLLPEGFHLRLNEPAVRRARDDLELRQREYDPIRDQCRRHGEPSPVQGASQTPVRSPDR